MAKLYLSKGQVNLANNLVYHGETDLSHTILQDVFKLQPDSPQAHWALSSSHKAKDCCHIEEMQILLQQRQNNPRALAFYHYAIVKEYEDQQQWEQAFEAFSKGAAARRSSVDFDEQSEIDMFDYLKQHYMFLLNILFRYMTHCFYIVSIRIYYKCTVVIFMIDRA